MHIEINDNTTIQSLWQVFSNFYPYLQIAFYRKPHKKYETSADTEWINPRKTIGEVKQTHLSALVEIYPLSKVAEIEKEFLERLGLSVQVLQMKNDRWVQTTGMDDFTLRELNELSRNTSDEYILSEPDSEYEEE